MGCALPAIRLLSGAVWAAQDFYECQEGSSEHDDLFHAAQEQAWLKCTKGTLAASYASFELHRRARRALSAISNLSGRSERSAPSAPLHFNSSVEVTMVQQWLGRTMQQWSKEELPPTGEGPYWAQGDGKGLMVRQGPNYKKFRRVDSVDHALICFAWSRRLQEQGRIAGQPLDIRDFTRRSLHV